MYVLIWTCVQHRLWCTQSTRGAGARGRGAGARREAGGPTALHIHALRPAHYELFRHIIKLSDVFENLQKLARTSPSSADMFRSMNSSREVFRFREDNGERAVRHEWFIVTVRTWYIYTSPALSCYYTVRTAADSARHQPGPPRTLHVALCTAQYIQVTAKL